MNNWISLANYSMGTAALLLTVIALVSVVINRTMDRWSHWFFGLMFSVLFLYSLLNYFSVLSWMLSAPWLDLSPKASLYVESLLSGLCIPLLTVYLLHCTGEEWRKSRVFFLIASLFAAYVILLTVAQFTTFIYYYTPDRVYHRGPWYPILLVPTVLSMAALFIAILRRRDRLSRRQFPAMLIYTVIPLISMLIQMAFYGLYMIVFGITIAAMFLYVFMMMDQVENHVRQQEENINQRASILVLQMRPHFIYNTLLSIYALCAEDPQKAQKVILDFSSYLRQNFTAIVREDAIPFTEELEHTRSYLSVEQARFEDMLFVKYDTPFMNFRLPPLTLQPIVENAVKHGVDPELGPLTITVQTRETESGTEITVANDGPPYAPGDDNEPHIALNNIRQRLKFMCGGELTIRAGKLRGTIVTITIPDKTS